MAKKQGLGSSIRPKLISIAVASCFVTSTALANPTSPTVVNGAAAIVQNGNLLQVTNTPSAIINWQSFSIGANEITRFIQQSQASAVLNRVVGAGGAIDPSVILGALQSNGRVFLINPSGILFGAGAQVDVAGLVASSLNLSDADFLANRIKFSEVVGAGSVINQGNITTGSGGQVYLVGSAVTNNGIITSPQGEVVLAAGNSVELVSPGTPNLRVEITAPDNQAVNLGQVVADAGRVGIYAGLIRNAGTVSASSAVAEGGKILLKAGKNVTLESTSILDASGNGGGTIEVLSKNGGTVNIAGRLDTSAPVSGNGGFIDTSADNFRIADGTVVTTAAPNGRTGNWLIDPTNIWIAVDTTSAYGAGAPFGVDTSADYYGSLIEASGVVSDSFLSVANLQNALGATSVTVSTANAAAYGSGDINVVDPVSWSNGNSLTLLANNNVNVNSSITNGGTGNIALYAGWNGVSASVPSVTAGYGGININAAVSTSGNVFLVAGNSIYGASGSITGNQLLADGGLGGVFLEGANMVNTLAGKTGTGSSAGFHFNNGQLLTIGSVTKPGGGTVSGITTGNGEIKIDVTGGGLTVSQPISATQLATPPYYGGSIWLTADGDVSINSQVSVQGANGVGGPTADGISANVSIYSNSGQIAVSAPVTVTAGNGASTLDAYGGFAYSYGGGSSIYLGAATGISVGANLTATAGNGGTATATSGYAYANGGSAYVNLMSDAGSILGSGNIAATSGAGGTANAYYGGDVSGGYAQINVENSNGLVNLGGTITAMAKNGGSVSAPATSANAYSWGGNAFVEAVSATSNVTLKGVSAIAGAGGTASAGSFHSADGGDAQVEVFSPGLITIGSSGATVTGAAGGGGGSPRSGGSAELLLANFTDSCGECFVLTSAGSASIGGNVNVTGGAGTGSGAGADGGVASLAVFTTGNITQTAGTMSVKGGAGPNAPAPAFVGMQSGTGNISLSGAIQGNSSDFVLMGFSAGGNITLLPGSSISATSTGPNVIGLDAGGNITLGGNVSSSGSAGTAGWLTNAVNSMPPEFAGILPPLPSNFAGIGMSAGNAIISTGGVLDVVNSGGPTVADPEIRLSAVNGIGTIASPVLIKSNSNNTELNFRNSGTTTGDIAVSFTTGDVSIDQDVVGTFNNNPNGTYFIQVQNGNFLLTAPFLPGAALPTALLPGQSVKIMASGNVVLDNTPDVASIVASGTGTVTLQGGGTISTATGTQLAGSAISLIGAAIASAGDISGGALSATATGALNITGGTLNATAINLAGSTISSSGSLIGAPVNATATGGGITLNQSPGISLGLLSATGAVSVSSGGAIVDGNAGANIIAPSATLAAGAGIGSFADPLETQVASLGLSSGSGEIGIINTGNLVLSGLSLSGAGVAAVGSSGTMTVSGPASSGGDLLLTANGTLTANQNVSASGTAELDSLADVVVASAGSPVSVTGTTVLLIAQGNVKVGSASASQPTSVTASDLVGISAGGNFTVAGGSNSGASSSVTGNGTGVGIATIGDVTVTGGSGGNAYATVIGTDTAMQVGGTVHITQGSGSGSYATIESISPTTIMIDFPNLGIGGYFVNGVEGAVTSGNSGFFAGGAPAVLNQNLLITYGLAPPPLPPTTPPSELPPPVDSTLNQIIASTNEQGSVDDDEKKFVNEVAAGNAEGDKDKQNLPVCK